MEIFILKHVKYVDSGIAVIGVFSDSDSLERRYCTVITIKLVFNERKNNISFISKRRDNGQVLSDHIIIHVFNHN